MGARERPFQIVLLNGHVLNNGVFMFVPIDLCCFLTLVKEIYFCCGKWLMQRLITALNIENK